MTRRRRRRAGFFARLARAEYRGARLARNLDAIEHPEKAPKRIANRWIGRHIVRRFWIR